MLLKEMRPSEELFVMAFNMSRDLWDMKLASTKLRTTSMKKELAQIELKIFLFLERIVEASSATIIRTYEDKVTELEENKLVLSERIKNCGKPLTNFDETYRTAFQFLGNPHKLWASERFEDKRAVLKLVFAHKLAYHRNQGYRTDRTTLPFKALKGLSDGESEVVQLTGRT